MNLIEHIIEPIRLLLTWQPLDDRLPRSRLVVAEIFKAGTVYNFRYLVDSADFKSAINYGFQSYPAFKDVKKTYTEGVIEAFMLRLPPRRRTDFSHFLTSVGLDPEMQFSDAALLGYSEGRLPSDGFLIVHPFEGSPFPAELLLDVAGYRYYLPEFDTSLPAVIDFTHEPENEFDPNAVKISVNGVKAGYVNRCQTQAFLGWLAQGRSVTAVVHKKIGTPHRPRLQLFVKIR